MEPYRAFVGDKLPDNQLNFGYQMQSLFVGAGILLAMLNIFFKIGLGGELPVQVQIPKWLYYSFFIGSFLSIYHFMDNFKTPEIPPSEEELQEIELFRF